MTKPWWKSKTLWIGALTVTMAGIEAYQNGASVPTIMLAVLGAALFIIRPATDKKLTK